ncbi:GDP-mannose transporter into the lumen of the Golgi [Linnemannia zychae]|nr:GDP-mannose transporter into the lumen of the Golgi [Linnemannia zychae]
MALPQRDIYNVEIVDSKTGILQVLDSLQRSGPLHVKGWVPIEETKLATAKNAGKLVYIFGEIVEWTHQYDPAHPKRPIFWLKSYGTVTPEYNPYFAPLAKVCSYLDALVQLVIEMRIKDDLQVLIPQVAVLLAEPESVVTRMLKKHRKQLLDLGGSDSIIRGSNFYKAWVAEQASGSLESADESRISQSPEFIDLDSYDNLEDNERINTDKEIDFIEHRAGHDVILFNTHESDNNDINISRLPPTPLKDPLPIVSYDMADKGIIPELETKVEVYKELPAPCGDEFCYRHPPIMKNAHNALSDDIELLFNKFKPTLTLSPSQSKSATKLKSDMESCSETAKQSEATKSLVSHPASFFCPVQGCPTTICNITIATYQEFIASISRHISTHDLNEGDTERVLRDYLAKPWRRPTRPKVWDITAKQLNTKTPTLNLHVYWMLNSKKTPSQKFPTQVSGGNSSRSHRKRIISQSIVQTTPSSSSTSSPRSTSSVRQSRIIATTSVAQFMEGTETASTKSSFDYLDDASVSNIETTSTSVLSIAANIADTSVIEEKLPRSNKHHHQDENFSSSSTFRRARSKRRVISSDSPSSGDDGNQPSRKLQRIDQPLHEFGLDNDSDTKEDMKDERMNPRRSSRSRRQMAANPPQDSLANSATISILAYCTSSIVMTVTNKMVLSHFDFNMNFLLLAIQAAAAVIMLWIFKKFGLITFRRLDITEAKKWFPISLGLVAMIYTGSKSLQFLSISVYTIFKNLTIILIAYGEVLWFGSKVTPMMLLSFVVMVLSSVTAGWSDIKLSSLTSSTSALSAELGTTNGSGYFWMAANCISSAAYVLYMRKRIRHFNFKDYDTVYYNNLLSFPVMLGLSMCLEGWKTGELQRTFAPEVRSSLSAAIILSGISSFLISYGSAWCVRCTSSTTYSMVGALNKLPVAASGIVFFGEPATTGNVFGILFGLIAGLLYSYSKTDQAQKNLALANGSSLSSSKADSAVLTGIPVGESKGLDTIGGIDVSVPSGMGKKATALPLYQNDKVAD